MQTGELPRDALLNRYRRAGAFTDCYFIEVPRSVSQPEYIKAFYTSPLFKIERFVLKFFVRRPSTDLQVEQLASGEVDGFAAWRVEERSADQLLMCDDLGKTRSWLMSVAAEVGGTQHTRLYFGSAVVPKRDRADRNEAFSCAFHALSSLHAMYSRALLRAAWAQL